MKASTTLLLACAGLVSCGGRSLSVGDFGAAAGGQAGGDGDGDGGRSPTEPPPNQPPAMEPPVDPGVPTPPAGGSEFPAVFPGSACQPGTYVSSPPGGAEPEVCAACPTGTFSRGVGWSSCIRWSTCPEGWLYQTLGSPGADSICNLPAVNQIGPGTVRALEVDPTAGAVFVAGYTWLDLPASGDLGSKDAFVARFDGIYSLTWLDQFGTEGEDAAFAMTRTSSGDLLVGGQVEFDYGGPIVGLTDAFVRGMSAGGDELFISQFGSPEHDYVEAIAEAPDGRFLVVGKAEATVDGSPHQGEDDIFLVMHDADGSILWTKQLGESGDDQPTDVVFDGEGGFYLSGFSNSAGDWGYDGFLARFAEDMEPIWFKTIATPENDFVSAITLVPGGVALVGHTAGRMYGSVNFGGADVFVATVTVGGDVVDGLQYGTLGGELPRDIVAAADGSLYVAGSTSGSFPLRWNIGAADAFVTKIAPGGTIEWTHQYGTTANDSASALAITDKLLIAGEASEPLYVSRASEVGVYVAEIDL